MLRCLLLVLLLSFSASPLLAATPQEDYERGLALGKAKRFEEAASLIRRAADAGLAPAQYTLGTMYAFGDGVPQSRDVARTWYEKAAAQEHAGALYNLGLYYDRGITVAPDPARALEYYRRGARAGDAKAAYNAGQMLMLGQGVPENAQEGVRLIEQSAALGEGKASASLGYIYQTGFGVRKDAAHALEHYARAEQRGIGGTGERRESLAATVLEEGLALERDRHGRAALELQDLACRYGQFFACYNAGRMRYRGEFVTRDVTTAMSNFRAACKWEDAPGCRALADAVMAGASATPEDLKMTVSLATSRCNAKDAAACHNLAILKLQPRYGMNDAQGAMNLFAQNCLNKGFQPSCQPYFDMYNASLPKSSGSGSSGGMNWLEQGIIDVLGIVAGTMQAVGSAGAYSQGSYAGYSAYAPSASTGSGSSGYSAQDRINFNNFIDSIKHPSVQCRPGNPYC